MTIFKKLLTVVLMMSSMSAVFGHSAIQLKKELVCIDNFTKALREIDNPEVCTFSLVHSKVRSFSLVAYLEDVLQNDANGWDGEARYVSDDEVLAIVRVIKADIPFKLKQREIGKIAVKELKRDVQIKRQRELKHAAYIEERDNMQKQADRVFVGCCLIGLLYLHCYFR